MFGLGTMLPIIFVPPEPRQPCRFSPVRRFRRVLTRRQRRCGTLPKPTVPTLGPVGRVCRGIGCGHVRWELNSGARRRRRGTGRRRSRAGSGLSRKPAAPEPMRTRSTAWPHSPLSAAAPASWRSGHFVWPDADTGTAQHASGPMCADEGAGARGAAGTALCLAELSRSRIGWSQGPRARSASRPTPDAPRQRPYPIHRGGALPGKPNVCRRSSAAVSTLGGCHHPNRARRAHPVFPVPARPGVRDRRAVRACSWPGWQAWLPVPPSL